APDDGRARLELFVEQLIEVVRDVQHEAQILRRLSSRDGHAVWNELQGMRALGGVGGRASSCSAFISITVSIARITVCSRYTFPFSAKKTLNSICVANDCMRKSSGERSIILKSQQREARAHL